MANPPDGANPTPSSLQTLFLSCPSPISRQPGRKRARPPLSSRCQARPLSERARTAGAARQDVQVKPPAALCVNPSRVARVGAGPSQPCPAVLFGSVGRLGMPATTWMCWRGLGKTSISFDDPKDVHFAPQPALSPVRTPKRGQAGDRQRRYDFLSPGEGRQLVASASLGPPSWIPPQSL